MLYIIMYMLKKKKEHILKANFLMFLIINN